MALDVHLAQQAQHLAVDATALSATRDQRTSARATTSSPGGLGTLPDAHALLSTGENLVVQYITEGPQQVAAIRIVDSTTGKVVASSPPDTIVQLQQEIETYQKLGQSARPE